MTLVPFDLWVGSGGTVGVRWRSGGGAFSCLSETCTFSFIRYKTWREKRKKDRGLLLQSVKDGARSDQEPENVLIPDVNIQDLHAGKKQKKNNRNLLQKKYT